MRTRISIAALAGLLALVVVAAGRVAAHPLGNFSISQYSAIHLARNEIAVRYLLDLAEIPTFQEMQEAGIAPQAGDVAVEKYAADKADSLRDALRLEINGRQLTLQPQSHEIIFPSGAGGLPTMKIGVLYKARIPADSVSSRYSLDYRDGNFAGRAGWKEIIAVAESGATILNSSVPATDRSGQLSNYPTDLLNSPPQRLAAAVAYAMSGISQANAAVHENDSSEPVPAFERKAAARPSAPPKKPLIGRDSGLPGESNTPDGPSALPNRSALDEAVQVTPNKQSTPRDSFTELIASPELGWSIVLIGLAIAGGLGAFHALEPGHGKTLVAAYLVGSRGTVKDALLLGLTVTAAHTAGVYLLGGITLYASQYVVPERLYPWLGVASGAMITMLGMVLVVQRWRGRAAAHAHAHHTHAQGAHHHEHVHAHEVHDGHDHGHNHHHGKASLRELLTLGISGGIVPCPAALVVLLSALSLNRIGFGLLLIVAFSAGLAAVLIAIGLLMVYARRFMADFQNEGKWVTRWLPIAASAFIVAVGIGLTWQAFQALGLTHIPQLT